MGSTARALLVALLLGTAGSAFAQTPASSDEPPPLSDHELLKKYVWDALGPSGAVHATIESALDQWRDSPDAWSQDQYGYAARWASEYAASAIGSTAEYGVARLMHQDPSFVRCQCEGFSPRLGHALAAPFKARTADGRWVFSPATVVGLTAENIVPAATWYPAPHGVRSGAGYVATSVLSKMAVDVMREFIPKRFTKFH
ncbi:MAG TPA: hypothetical protein VH497_13940 [Vicinamibacterales bacterium]|jgi:hypothetical protein